MKPMTSSASDLDFVHTGPKDLAGKYLRMFCAAGFLLP